MKNLAVALALLSWGAGAALFYDGASENYMQKCGRHFYWYEGALVLLVWPGAALALAPGYPHDAPRCR
jgi:hypothetical protein